MRIIVMTCVLSVVFFASNLLLRDWFGLDTRLSALAVAAIVFALLFQAWMVWFQRWRARRG